MVDIDGEYILVMGIDGDWVYVVKVGLVKVSYNVSVVYSKGVLFLLLIFVYVWYCLWVFIFVELV